MWQPTPVFLPGESPRTEDLGGLQSIGSQRVRHYWSNLSCRYTSLQLQEVAVWILSLFYSWGNRWDPEKLTNLLRITELSGESRWMCIWCLAHNADPWHTQQLGLSLFIYPPHCSLSPSVLWLLEVEERIESVFFFKKKLWHWNMYITICETNLQSRFDAWYRILGAGALRWPRGMVWGGNWERGSGWGTHVHHGWFTSVYGNHYNIVK